MESRQLLCSDSKPKQVIFQAILLPSDGKTAEELRNATERWVLMKPIMIISGASYQLDTDCSVVITEVGDTSCNTLSPAASTAGSKINHDNNIIIMAYSIGGGILLLLAIAMVVVILTVCVLLRRKSKIPTR